MCTCGPTQVKEKEIIGLSECVTTSLRHHVGALKRYSPLSVKPLTDLNTTCITFMFTVHQRFCEGLWMCGRVHCYALLTWLIILPKRCCTASSVELVCGEYWFHRTLVFPAVENMWWRWSSLLFLQGQTTCCSVQSCTRCKHKHVNTFLVQHSPMWHTDMAEVQRMRHTIVCIHRYKLEVWGLRRAFRRQGGPVKDYCCVALFRDPGDQCRHRCSA